MAIASAADDRITVVTRDKGQKGDTGTAGLDGQGFNGVRQSLLDAPLCRLFTPNKLVDTLAGSLTATRATTATYVDRYGVVKTAAIDEMREESEGWLIEGASTNLLTYSEDFGNPAWVKAGATVAADATAAPDGAITADTITSTATSFARVQQAISLAGGNSYTLSFFAKSGNTNFVHSTLDLPGVATTRFYANLDTLETDADIGLGSNTIAASAESLANGWVRVSAKINIDPANTGTYNIFFGPANALSGFVDVGDFVYLWGAQLEALPFSTSYIPTTTAAATRAADVVTASGENNTMRITDSFSIVTSFKIIGYNDLNRICEFAGSGDIQTRVFSSSTGVFFTSTGNSNLFAQNYTQGQNYTYCVTVEKESSEIRQYLNGVGDNDNPAVNAATTNSIPDELRFGSSGAGNFLFGHLKDFRIYDLALNADEAAYLAGVK